MKFFLRIKEYGVRFFAFISPDVTENQSFIVFFLKTTLLTIPALMATLVLLFADFDKVVSGFILGLILAESAAISAILGSGVMQLLRRYILRRRLHNRSQSYELWWNSLGAAIFLGPGIWLGNQLLVKAAKQFYGMIFDPPKFETYRAHYFLGIVILGILHLAAAWHRATLAKRQIELEKIRLENSQLKAKFSALTAQMDPHFLFNTLNSIAELIHTNPKLAEKAIENQSSLYRDVLLAVKKERHGIVEELKICERYLQIEKIRFGDRLQFTVLGIEDLVETKVEIPVMLLQPLVENAVKYGILSDVHGGKIVVTASHSDEEVELTVTDNGRSPSSKVSGGTGTALENCRQRLALMYPDRSELMSEELSEGGRKVTIRIFPERRGLI